MHFIPAPSKKSTADLFHPGSQILKNHNLLHSNSKLSQNKENDKKKHHYIEQGIIDLSFFTRFH